MSIQASHRTVSLTAAITLRCVSTVRALSLPPCCLCVILVAMRQSASDLQTSSAASRAPTPKRGATTRVAVWLSAMFDLCMGDRAVRALRSALPAAERRRQSQLCGCGHSGARGGDAGEGERWPVVVGAWHGVSAHAWCDRLPRCAQRHADPICWSDRERAGSLDHSAASPLTASCTRAPRPHRAGPAAATGDPQLQQRPCVQPQQLGPQRRRSHGGGREHDREHQCHPERARQARDRSSNERRAGR